MAAMFLAIGISTVSGQNIRGHYVARAQKDGTIYHTLPCTMFEHPAAGGLTFDITYKEHLDGWATVNFTYETAATTPIDSVRFESERIRMSGPTVKIYIEPAKRRWKHRYSFRTPVDRLCPFFDAETSPRVILYGAEGELVFEVKRAAWRNYAPIGYRIFEMVRVNEARR